MGTGRGVRTVLALAALLGGAGPAMAQDGGRVVGRVTDALGRAVEGATVVAVHADSGGTRGTARSGETGGFQLSALPAGRYRVRVERDGFEAREEQVTVERGERRTLIVRLRDAMRRARRPAGPQG